VDYPKRVTCGGNRYHFADDWETPDTYAATFDFGDKGISWDGQSCDPRGFEAESVGVNFYGEKGCISIAGTSCRIFDLNNKLVREIIGKNDDLLHFRNFIQAMLISGSKQKVAASLNTTQRLAITDSGCEDQILTVLILKMLLA